MVKKETTRDRLSIWKASLFPANYHTDQSLHLNEKAFNGLLASSRIKFHERRKLFIAATADTSLTQPLQVTPKVRQFLRLPWQEKINTDQLIIHANPNLLRIHID